MNVARIMLSDSSCVYMALWSRASFFTGESSKQLGQGLVNTSRWQLTNNYHDGVGLRHAERIC